jgi:hypothetical protein
MNIIDSSMLPLMVAVKTELECYLVHMFVSLYTLYCIIMGIPHLLVSVVELPLKKLLSDFSAKTGCSSGIKCPNCGMQFFHEKDRLHHVQEEKKKKTDIRRHK